MPLLVTVGDGEGGSGVGSAVGLELVLVGRGLAVAFGGVALGRFGAGLLLLVRVLVPRGAAVRDRGAALVDTAEGTALGLRGAARPARGEVAGLACSERAAGELFATAPEGGAGGAASAVASRAITVTRPSVVVTLNPAVATRLPRAGWSDGRRREPRYEPVTGHSPRCWGGRLHGRETSSRACPGWGCWRRGPVRTGRSREAPAVKRLSHHSQ